MANQNMAGFNPSRVAFYLVFDEEPDVSTQIDDALLAEAGIVAKPGTCVLVSTTLDLTGYILKKRDDGRWTGPQFDSPGFVVI